MFVKNRKHLTALIIILLIVSCSVENATTGESDQSTIHSNNNPEIVKSTKTSKIIQSNPPAESASKTNFPVPEIVNMLAPSVVEIATFGKSDRGVGTGIILDVEGHILTNKHVIKYATEITVAFSNGQTLKGSKFREDPILDLAIIKVENNDKFLIPAEFGDSKQLKVGEEVIAIGHALGLEGGPSVSKGIISALNRTISTSIGSDMTGLIQTDAAINSGNSGGPLVNNEAKVIGINTITTSGDGIGFAININDAIETSNKLISLGDPPPPGYLGISFDEITPALAFLFDLPVNHLWITYIQPGSPAEIAGIERDDILLKLNETNIQSSTDLAEFLRNHESGSQITITFLRNKKYIIESEVILSEKPQ
ncbi:MAG: protease DO family protein [Chloroflexi bacterium]|nr:protease DO family protein [Chloroflexota bacterium]